MPIFVSPALVITPADDFPATFPRIGWDNQVQFGNVAADHADAAAPATNLANPNTNLRWASTSTAEQVLTVTGLTGETDYVGIARHNFGSGAMAVSVEAVTAESDPSFVEVFEAVLPANDGPLLLQFEPGFFTSLQVRIVPDAVAPFAAVLYVGKLLTVMRGLQPGFTPLRDAEVIETMTGRSESGEHLGSIITGAELATTAQINVLDPTWYHANMAGFVAAANRGRPFFFAWNPGEYPDDVSYCWLDANVRPVMSVLTREMDITLPIKGLAL